MGTDEVLMRPENIRRRLPKFGIREGANVFFLSDERDVGFWSALAPHYQGVRYTQFPELAEVIDLPGGRAPAGGDPSQRTLVPMAMEVRQTRDKGDPVYGQGAIIGRMSMALRTTLVTGVTGQDGACLAELRVEPSGHFPAQQAPDATQPEESV